VNEKILITGSTGLLGIDLMAVLKRDYRVMGVSTANFDIRDKAQIDEFLGRMRPDIVLHAAAWADVDGCESDKEKAMAVNAEGAGNIAKACKENGARMIYYSTDYVFDGLKGSLYTESDKPNPINVYGLSKLKGEEYILNALNDATIMRISWLYGTAKDCFVTGIIKSGLDQFRAKQAKEPYNKIKVVSDQSSCPTWTVDIADQTRVIMEENITGIIHAVSYGALSRYELAQHIFEELSWDIEMEPCRLSDFQMRAPRPPHSGLANSRLDKMGKSVMRDYQETMREFLMIHKEA